MADRLADWLEENLLCLVCWSDIHCTSVTLNVPIELYSFDAHKKIATAAYNFIDSHGRAPGVHLRDILDHDMRRDPSLLPVLQAMERVQAQIQPGFTLEQLDDFIESRQIFNAAQRAVRAVEAGRLGEAREHFQLPAKRLDRTTSTWLSDTAKWLSFLDRQDSGEFSSGIPLLDERNVRPRRGELFMTMAPSGRGKSWHLIQMGREALYHYHNILHISLENSLDQVQQRYTQAFFQLSDGELPAYDMRVFQVDALGRLARLDLERVEPKNLHAQSLHTLTQDLKPLQKRGSLLVTWFPTGTLTINGLNGYLEQLARAENFRPDIVLLDYLDLMYTPMRDTRVALGHLTRELRGMAGVRKFALATATQSNRISATAHTVGGHMVSEDWSKIGTSDTVVTHSQTAMEFESNLARIYVVKSRNSKDRWAALITQHYATGQFCLDSVPMDKKVEDEIERLSAAGDDDKHPPPD